MSKGPQGWNGAQKPKEYTEGVVTGLTVGVARTEPPKPKTEGRLPEAMPEGALLKVEKIGPRKGYQIHASGRAKLK